MNSRVFYSTTSAYIFSLVVPSETPEDFVKLKEWISYSSFWYLIPNQLPLILHDIHQV